MAIYMASIPFCSAFSANSSYWAYEIPDSKDITFSFRVYSDENVIYLSSKGYSDENVIYLSSKGYSDENVNTLPSPPALNYRGINDSISTIALAIKLETPSPS